MNEEHYIQYVHIDGDKTHVECICGWKSKKHEDETKAKRDFAENHEGDN